MLAAAVQCSVERENVRVNVTAACNWIDQAASEGCELVVLPECCLTGYVFESREALVAHSIKLDGAEIRAIAEKCRAAAIHAIIGFFEQRNDKVYNSAALFGPNGLIGVHRKNHLPYLGGDRFVDLPEGPQASTFDTAIGVIGIAICYEIRFPEVMRTLMLNGADIIALPTNWPVESTILADHFTLVRAAENMVFFIAANRHDTELETVYLGNSQIIDPRGRVLVRAHQESGLFKAELDLELARDKKIVIDEGKFELNPITDRKPEAYRL